LRVAGLGTNGLRQALQVSGSGAVIRYPAVRWILPSTVLVPWRPPFETTSSPSIQICDLRFRVVSFRSRFRVIGFGFRASGFGFRLCICASCRHGIDERGGFVTPCLKLIGRVLEFREHMALRRQNRLVYECHTAPFSSSTSAMRSPERAVQWGNAGPYLGPMGRVWQILTVKGQGFPKNLGTSTCEPPL